MAATNDNSIIPTHEYLQGLTVPQLKHILREHNMKIGGNKIELVTRIVEAQIEISTIPPEIPEPPAQANEHPNLRFDYNVGEIYVASIELSIDDYLFVQVHSRTKSGNIRFRLFKSTIGEYITNSPLECSYTIRPSEPFEYDHKFYIARKQKINGWGITCANQRYYIWELYNPNRTYIENRYY
jgi:hypothetical protein